MSEVILRLYFAALSVWMPVAESNVVFDCSWQEGDVRHDYIEASTTTNLQHDLWQYWNSWYVATNGTNLTIYAPLETNETCRFWRFSTWGDMDGDGLSNETELSQYYTNYQSNDTDGDGAPDDFEVALGLNPTNFDNWATIPKITCGESGEYSTLASALAAATTNSIIEIRPGTYKWANVRLPNYPVLITSPDGGRNRQVIIEGSGSGSYILSIPNDTRSIVRGIYFNLRDSSLLSAIWVGSGSIFSGNGGVARIENCYFQMSRKSGALSCGIYDYRYSKKLLTISGCVFNALGCDYARGCYFYDANPAVIEHCTFLNFPPATADKSVGVFYNCSIQNYQGDDIVCPMVIKSSLFDDSFTNTYAVAKGTGANFYDVSLRNCLLPSTNSLAECNGTFEDCLVTNSGVYAYGLLSGSSPAIDKGGPASSTRFDIKGDDRDTFPDIGAAEFIAGANVRDIDGDGLDDNRESALGTNPFLQDSDFDGVADMLELTHNSDPTNPDVVCFSLSVAVTNPVSQYLPLRCLLTAGNMTANIVQLTDSAAVTNGVNIIEFEHNVYDLSGKLYFSLYQLEGTDIIYQVSVTPNCHELSIGFELPQEVWDGDNDSIVDVWERENGLCTTNATDAIADFDSDGLINLHEYWVGCDPNLPDGSNTFISVLCRSIDSRLTAVIDADDYKQLYNNYNTSSYPGNFMLNTNCWAYGIDLSGVSPWNFSGGNKRAGVAISRRHILAARHFQLANTQILFHKASGGMHTNRIVASMSDVQTDFQVCLLQFDLPADVHPVKIFPESQLSEIRDGTYIPLIALDQEEKVLVHEIKTIANSITGQSPLIGNRVDFYEPWVLYDSGNPRFAVCGNEPLLMNIAWTGGGGSGASVPKNKVIIQTLMDALSTEYDLNTNDYQLVEFQFTENAK